MGKSKDNDWGGFIRKIRQPHENKELIKNIMHETEEHEIENFLFLSSGEGMVIRGMHYPDTAFDEDADLPVIFQTSEKTVLIAAWPQSVIKIFLDAALKGDKKDLESRWNNALEILSQEALEKIKKGEINEPF